MQLPKTYIVRAKLGELTDTLDHTGKITETNDVECSRQMMETALQSFGSSYQQTPPIYSALKHQGAPLYKLARHDLLSVEELEAIAQAKKKTVQLYELELLDFEYPFFTIRAKVSQGTYIRSLVGDIAQKLHTVATAYFLERTEIGSFSLKNAYSLEQLNDLHAVEAALISVDQLE